MQLITTYLLTAIAAIFWGANFNLAKPVVAEMHPYVAGASRYLIAAAVMYLITLYRDESVSLRYIKTYILLGLVGVFGFNLFFFLGMQSTSAINGALILALNPLLTSIIAYFTLHEKLDCMQILAFIVGLIGVAIVVLGAGARLQLAIGDIFIFGAALSWAFYNVLVGQLMPKDVSGVASTAGIMMVGAIALTVLSLISGQQFVIPSIRAGSALLIMALAGGVLAYLFWNAGVAKLGATQAAIFLNLVPITSMVIAAFEGVPPNHAQLIGGVLVIGAVLSSAIFANPNFNTSAIRTYFTK